MALSESRKNYERNRANNFKTVSAKYRKDSIELSRLNLYLEVSGISANNYIQQLIKEDLDNKGIPYPNNDWYQIII